MASDKESRTQSCKQSARKWLEYYADCRKKDQSPLDAASRALAVICLTEATSNYLAEFDPQALKQAQLALSGKSWENFAA